MQIALLLLLLLVVLVVATPVSTDTSQLKQWHSRTRTRTGLIKRLGIVSEILVDLKTRLFLPKDHEILADYRFVHQQLVSGQAIASSLEWLETRVNRVKTASSWPIYKETGQSYRQKQVIGFIVNSTQFSMCHRIGSGLFGTTWLISSYSCGNGTAKQEIVNGTAIQAIVKVSHDKPLLQSIKHKYHTGSFASQEIPVLKTLGLYYASGKVSNKDYIVMKYFPGTLFDAIVAKCDPTRFHVLVFVRALLEAHKNLRQKGILHLDIHIGNVLFSGTTFSNVCEAAEEGQVKADIVDFGHAQFDSKERTGGDIQRLKRRIDDFKVTQTARVMSKMHVQRLKSYLTEKKIRDLQKDSR